jgi:hypothetical protein
MPDPDSDHRLDGLDRPMRYAPATDARDASVCALAERAGVSGATDRPT